MVEVVRITREERSKPFTNHVVVEVTQAGPVRAGGASNRNGHVEYYAPPMFQNLRTALVSAMAWAAEYGINVVHLYAGEARPSDDCAILELLSEEAKLRLAGQAQTVKE